MRKKLSFVVASSLGVGYCPFASGTAGSLATLPLAFAVAYFYGVWGILSAAVIAFFAGVAASREVLKYTKHDPSLIVIDEVVGQLLAFALVADKLVANTQAWAVYVIGFALFRLFDIWKPQPARWADQKVLNAWGVMLDDVFAGIYAALCLYGICYYLPLL